jgi:hypothetical protein
MMKDVNKHSGFDLNPILSKWTDDGKRVGRGQAAQVFASPNDNVVIKTFSTFLGNSEATMQFLRMATKHQDNPYFPKIYSIKQYKGPIGPKTQAGKDTRGLPTIVVKMEKLQKITTQDIDWWLDCLGIVRPAGMVDDDPNETLSNHVKALFDSSEWVTELYHTTRDQNLKKALRLLRPLLAIYGSDLIRGNFMMRSGSTNQLVFTDPLDDSL